MMLGIIFVMTVGLVVQDRSAASNMDSELAYDLRCASALTRQINELRDFAEADQREHYVQTLTFYYGRLSETAPTVTSKQIETLAAVDDNAEAGAAFCDKQYRAFLDRLLREQANPSKE